MKLLLSLSLVLLLGTTLASQAANLTERINQATKILAARQGSIDPIPAEILKNAKGVAICTVTKGGIAFGGQGGGGVVMVRHIGATGSVWRAPIAFDMSGASFGAQLGLTTIRYIIILNTEKAIGQFVGTGKIKWDATATGTVGEETGVESESTRKLEKRAVLVYRDSGGLFGGATFGGSTIEVSDEANQAAYGENIHVLDILEGKVELPKSSARLYSLLDGIR